MEKAVTKNNGPRAITTAKFQGSRCDQLRHKQVKLVPGRKLNLLIKIKGAFGVGRRVRCHQGHHDQGPLQLTGPIEDTGLAVISASTVSIAELGWWSQRCGLSFRPSGPKKKRRNRP